MSDEWYEPPSDSLEGKWGDRGWWEGRIDDDGELPDDQLDLFEEVEEEYEHLYDNDDEDHTLSTKQDRKRKRWKDGD